MTENTKLWDMLGRTDPKHTKPFTRGGGFKGTAIKPMWSYRRMTEEFGPCGIGWGVGEPQFQVIPGVNQEVMVYCTASIWFAQGNEVTRTIYGVGGDKIVSYIRANEQYKRPERWENDDEAFKKAYTDAVTNALKLIGVGADVHMGMFDDNKYVNTMKQEFADEPAQTGYLGDGRSAAAKTPPKQLGSAEPDDGYHGETAQRSSSASLKRDGAWQKLTFQLSADFGDCKSLVTLSKLRADYRQRARENGWPKAWLEALANEFDQFEDSLNSTSADGPFESAGNGQTILSGG